MFKHEATIEIATLPRTGFAFLADPTNQVRLTPGLTAVTATRPGAGFALRYRYEIAGVTLTGRLHDALRRPPTRLVRSLSGSLDGSLGYRLVETNDGTKVSFGATLQPPEAVLEAIPVSVVRTSIEQDVTATLEALRSVVES